jgi:hypothetical protein
MADRWPSYIEEVSGTSGQTINSTTFTSVNGATITFTPSVDCSVLFIGRVEATTNVAVVGSDLWVRSNASTTGASLKKGAMPPGAVGQDSSVEWFNLFKLSANVVCTITIEAALRAAGSSFTLQDISFVLVVMPRLYAPL